MKSVLFAAVLASNAAFASSYQPQFDPSSLKPSGAEPPNQVLVIGTPHLSSLPKSFSADHLGLLEKKLAAWKPQVIMVEALSGAQCDYLRRHLERYRDTVETYCWDTAQAKAASGLDIPSAIVEVDKTLAAWPAEPSPGQRRRLALLFLSAGDPGSALVQWLRLSAGERKAGDALNGALVENLNQLMVKRNEKYLLAAPLAATLGLERIYAMDDHTADMNVPDEKGYADALRRLWDNPDLARRNALDAKLHAHLDSDDGVLELYRTYNQPDYPQLVYQSDFGAALGDKSPQGFGRLYVGYWETRNMRMVSNVREVLAATPGRRALVIVGASHKGYFDAYLNMSHDVRLVDATEVLH